MGATAGATLEHPEAHCPPSGMLYLKDSFFLSLGKNGPGESVLACQECFLVLSHRFSWEMLCCLEMTGHQACPVLILYLVLAAISGGPL